MPAKRDPDRSALADSGNCIEVAAATRAVAVRDSKDPHGPALTSSQPG